MRVLAGCGAGSWLLQPGGGSFWLFCGVAEKLKRPTET